MTALHITVPGRPVGVNATYANRRRGGRNLTPEAEDYRKRIQLAAVVALGPARNVVERCIVLVTAYRCKPGDADACTKPVQDALQGFVYADDSAVVFTGGWQAVDALDPRTEIEIRSVSLPLTDPLSIQIPAGIGLPTRSEVAEAVLDRAEREEKAAASARLFGSVLKPKAKERVLRAKGRLAPSVKRFGRGER